MNMKKYIVLSLAIVFLFSSTTLVHAELTTSQVNSVISLLQAFGADQNVVDNVRISLIGGTPTTTTSVTTTSEFSCMQVDLKYNLYLGINDNKVDGDVTKLQKFLTQDTDIYPAGLITGYFGPMTERAVQKWQAENKIVSSGAPDTTGYGVVGPKTRDKISGVCKKTSAIRPVIVTPVPPIVTPVITPTTTPSSITPVVPAIPIIPSAEGGGATLATPATTTPPVDPTPLEDTTGPLITNLSVSPTSIDSGESVTFTATIEDQSGIENVIYDIRYPNSSYVLRPNCNFEGVKSGTCTFTESIDHGISPTLYGEYVIDSIRVTDSLDNLATYYPNGSVSGSSQDTHNLSIPTILINEPPTFIFKDNFNSYKDGNVLGQGEWSNYSNGDNFTVQASTTFEGAKSLFNNSPVDNVLHKIGNSIADGKQSIYIKTRNRSLWEDTNAMQVRIGKGITFASGVNISVLFNKDGTVIYQGGTIGRVVATYNDDEWTLLEIEWRSSDNKARYRINNEIWSTWDTFINSSSFTEFDSIGLDFDLREGTGEVYVDNIF
jgi:peptidoglycan hydrolase-like protein with peptidoglycan-binding domain